MHYLHVEKSPIEHVQYIDQNQMQPYAKTWVNLSVAHEIDIVQAGFHYYVKVSFSKDDYCYIASFDCEKAAKKYVSDILAH